MPVLLHYRTDIFDDYLGGLAEPDELGDDVPGVDDWDDADDEWDDEDDDYPWDDEDDDWDPEDDDDDLIGV